MLNTLKTTFVATALCVAGLANAAVIQIDTTYDLSSGLNNISPLDNGAVYIANGDSVVLNVEFANNQALTIGDGNEYLRGWLYAGDNNSSFSINNASFELTGFLGTGGASSFYNVGSVNSGQAHLGPMLSNFLSAGQEVTFSGFQVKYDVATIAQSPHEYSSLWFGAGGPTNIGPAPAISVSAPGSLALIGLGLTCLGALRKKKIA